MHNHCPVFQPILLGSDFNVYGMARSFHEEYQLKSIALCTHSLAPTKFSHILSMHLLEGLNTEEQFVSQLKKFYQEHLHNETTYILVPCGDLYAKLLSKFQDELRGLFLFSTNSFDIFNKLENKKTFYELCQKNAIPHPKTVVISKNKVADLQPIINELPFSYPVVLKASDSISYQPLRFEGKKKAYVIEKADELFKTIHLIYKTEYKDTLLIQEYIPGPDAHMRVLNAYVDQQQQIRLMVLGNPVLEDPSPESIGNYVAILPDFQPVIFETIRRLLTQIHYTGFANFDLKYDSRDQEYKLLEINLRQGRSSFFVTLNGNNLAKYLVDDLIFSTPFENTDLGKGNKLWLGAPAKLVLTYLSDESSKEKVAHYLHEKNYGTTSFYRKDHSLRHHLLQTYAFFRYYKKFRTYFKKE